MYTYIYAYIYAYIYVCLYVYLDILGSICCKSNSKYYTIL